MKAAIFTIDSGLYKAKKESAAASALKRILGQVGFEVKAAGVLPEDKKVLAAVMKRLADTQSVDLILTTGATGIRRRDCAPDVVEEISDRLLPGIPEAIRAYNIRYTKKAILNRSAAGIRKNTLIVNLPDSAKAAKESLEYILPELVQVVEILSL
ncbi:molybdenum cofactor biosynthesis protein [Clostridium sp. AF19-22AC]|jgi:molybdopterin adenylyltransferase|uniref:Molybdenum cofactor synthesis domain-containing protein n=1 Tax=Faecalicatena orotica TaxID=1544 RepID=A0A2Y9C409_9FIRM|nr:MULTISPECIES: molybdopterin-binding protein [Clostridia]PWJ31798.1 molybdenum cofactor synthesis domain-containing protein [Faecalicatena orotica]RHR32333.1 molybdenum cofactor biosynthesis protein [Clostridium sp. AF19-22AC]SSA53621.1 molybdenum cofactor synthesis domain-containing protein [Faecalicatena orotica]